MEGACKILFLEDNATDVDLMQHVLHAAHLPFHSQVHCLKEGFLEKVKHFKPDIILADYALPSFNGMDAFRMLKKNHADIPFILVTGVLSEQVALQCLEEGVDDFILKSSYKRLPVSISNAIRKKEVEMESVRMAAELQRSHDELRILINNRQEVVEEERLQIARNLHDELGQVLTALRIDIELLGKSLLSEKRREKSEIKAEIDGILQTISKINQSVIRISSGLRPEILDELGILEALEWLTVDFEKRSKIKCNLQVDLPEGVKFEKNLPITLFRVVQEALTNVVRHAKATSVSITMALNDEALHLQIRDNGKGIASGKIKDTSSLGLIGIRERIASLNGVVNIYGKRGIGTVLAASIPMHKPA